MLPQQKAGGRTGGYVALSLTCTLWGTTWIASKIGVNVMPPLQMASIRQLIAGLCFLLFFMVVKRQPLPTGKQWLWLIVLSLLMFVFANGFSTWSLKFIPSGLSALIGALYPLSVVVIERLFFKKANMSLLTWVGFILGIVGVGIVFYENAFSNGSGLFLVGLALSFFAMLSWSVGTLIIAHNKLKLDPYYATGWQMVLSAVMLYFLSAAFQPGIPINEIPVDGWLVILYLVVFGSVIAFIAFIYSMKTLPAAIASLYAYINPLVAMLTGALILNEKLTFYILWGAIVTLTGVFLVNFSMKRDALKVVEAEPEI